MDYNVSIYELFYNMSRCEDTGFKSIQLHIKNYMKFISVLKGDCNIQEINRLIDLEPEKYTNIPQYIYVYIAGTIETISEEIKIHVPAWVYDDYYSLNEPWFQEDIDKYTLIKDIILKTTPLPFRKRNMFISEQIISFL